MATDEGPPSLTASTPSDNNGPFPFMELAAEIRNKIYRYTFANEQTRTQACNLALLSLPKITGVSKQIRQEAVPLFFAETHFFVNVASNISTRRLYRRYADHWCHFRFKSVSGVLNMKRSARSSFQHAGPAGLIRHVEIRIVDPMYWSRNLFKTAGDRAIVAKMSFDVEKGMLSVTRLLGKDEVRMSPYGISEECYVWESKKFYRVQQQDVEDVLDHAEQIAREVGGRQGFAGLSLRDLDRIVRVFRYDAELHEMLHAK